MNKHIPRKNRKGPTICKACRGKGKQYRRDPWTEEIRATVCAPCNGTGRAA